MSKRDRKEAITAYLNRIEGMREGVISVMGRTRTTLDSDLYIALSTERMRVINALCAIYDC